MNPPGASVHGARGGCDPRAAARARRLEPASAGTTAPFGTGGGMTVSGRAVELLFSADPATAEFVPGWSERP